MNSGTHNAQWNTSALKNQYRKKYHVIIHRIRAHLAHAPPHAVRISPLDSAENAKGMEHLEGEGAYHKGREATSRVGIHA